MRLDPERQRMCLQAGSCSAPPRDESPGNGLLRGISPQAWAKAGPDFQRARHAAPLRGGGAVAYMREPRSRSLRLAV